MADIGYIIDYIFDYLFLQDLYTHSHFGLPLSPFPSPQDTVIPTGGGYTLISVVFLVDHPTETSRWTEKEMEIAMQGIVNN